MKKSTIWILTVLMALTFLGLLFMQIFYMRNMVRMRFDQFDEGVKQSLYAVSQRLEYDETKYFLEEEVEFVQKDDIYSQYFGSPTPQLSGIKNSISLPNDVNVVLTISGDPNEIKKFQMPTELGSAYSSIIPGSIGKEYNRAKSMIDEIVVKFISRTSNRSITERADSTVVRQYLRQELDTMGIKIPFEYAVVNSAGSLIYKSGGYNLASVDSADVFVQTLFPDNQIDKTYSLKVYFPTKRDYIFSSISFIYPTFAFTLILLIVFICTIIIAFRQKKLTEMKNDFINNMTHEFKTPISSISLAAQMLNDQSVRKSPAVLQQISTVINDETKRLRFQVEKVLQMSMFDKQKATLKLDDVDANLAIYNIVNTFKLKVEKYGGHITANLDAPNAIVTVDEMHFTNVIFNLLDNAVKYRREDVPLNLVITSRDISGERLRITVEDNGIGIKKDDLKKIFEKFYRVSTGNRHDVKGFGLGLAYVKKMVNELGGDISVESELGTGTKFIIILPLSKT